jgi:hypothetical protein
MSAEQKVLTKACQRKKDKVVYIDGALVVKQSVLVWQPAPGQDDEEQTYRLLSIKGPERAQSYVVPVTYAFLYNSYTAAKRFSSPCC